MGSLLCQDILIYFLINDKVDRNLQKIDLNNIINWFGLIDSKYYGKYLVSRRIYNIFRKLFLGYILFSVIKLLNKF